jgi:hypothetical protein
MKEEEKLSLIVDVGLTVVTHESIILDYCYLCCDALWLYSLARWSSRPHRRDSLKSHNESMIVYNERQGRMISTPASYS